MNIFRKKSKIPEQVEHYVEWKGGKLEFLLQRRKRQSIAIEVKTDGSLRVMAPRWLSLTTVKDFVKYKSEWIQKQQQKVRNLPPLHIQHYRNGDTIPYLGNKLRLRVKKGAQSHTHWEEGELHLQLNNADEQSVQVAVLLWQKMASLHLFEEILQEFSSQLKVLKIPLPTQLTVRKMTSRWGSCTSKGRITLNTELLSLPRQAAEYVVAHELCHRKHMNHSKEYYALLEKLLPSYRDSRKLLSKLPKRP